MVDAALPPRRVSALVQTQEVIETSHSETPATNVCVDIGQTIDRGQPVAQIETIEDGGRLVVAQATKLSDVPRRDHDIGCRGAHRRQPADSAQNADGVPPDRGQREQLARSQVAHVLEGFVVELQDQKRLETEDLSEGRIDGNRPCLVTLRTAHGSYGSFGSRPRPSTNGAGATTYGGGVRLGQSLRQEVDIHRNRARPLTQNARRARDSTSKLVQFFERPPASRDVHRQDVIRAGHLRRDRDLHASVHTRNGSTFMYWRQLLPMTRLSPMPEHLDVFTANLRRTREQRGLSQEAVGDRAGMTQSQYARIERGDVDPTIKTLKRLATALDITASELLRGV